MGIKIKKYIQKDDSNEIIVVKEVVNFNPITSIATYQKKFNKLISEEILYEGSFNDSKWAFYTQNYDIRYAYFNHELNPEMNLKLKAYALFKSDSCSVYGTVRAVRFISDFMYTSNYFDLKYLNKVQDEIKTWSDTKLSSSPLISEFLRFINTESNNEYFTLISKISMPKYNPRLIPSYHSIINFDFIIQDFIINGDIQLKFKFYPIIIWWELTKIIPLRPIELVELSRNCIEFDGEYYYINITRKKQKRNGKIKYKMIKPLNRIKITYELYSLIKIYKDYSDTINNSNNMFSYEIFKGFLKHKRSREKLSKKLTLDIVDTTRIARLLNNFLIEVVREKYGYTLLSKGEKYIDDFEVKEIEKILLGDTRHIAFCGMMLQGYNPLTIAQIGGHETLTEQLGYQSHLDDYIVSHTYIMAKGLRNKLTHNKNISLSNFNMNSKSNLIRESLLGLEKYKGRKIVGGRCMSENFPYECNSDGHYCCDYFIPDETLTQGLINKELFKVNDEIEIKTSFIKSALKHLIFAEKHDGSSDVITEDLKSNTNSLNTLMRNKATLQSYKMQLDKEI
jgi:hypothetical protein